MYHINIENTTLRKYFLLGVVVTVVVTPGVVSPLLVVKVSGAVVTTPALGDVNVPSTPGDDVVTGMSNGDIVTAIP